MQLPDPVDCFRHKLLQWYQLAQRPLPWRDKPSLYSTVVSEFMLQQTQVKTMLPYFKNWMRRFPDFQTLAKAAPETVLKNWEGLGYYSRARNLHKLAKAFIQLSQAPQSPEEWQNLPGIGPYTAAAISSIAQNFPAAVIDGNVVRVLARVCNQAQPFSSNSQAVQSFIDAADTLLDPNHPGDYNQALMELGATVCLKNKPNCQHCPLRSHCLALKVNPQHLTSLPSIQRPTIQKIEIDRALILSSKKILLHRIPDNAHRLAGQYEIPVLQNLPLTRPTQKPHTVKTRGIANQRIKESLFLFRQATEITCPSTYDWIHFDQLDQITLSGPHRKWLNQLLPAL
ncbi:MAG: Adenine DNA glycosylase [Opitutia bacterium UBA7350]|nr:MAG: Adenine DNA glycosylase [Opitutae bacterium UBA7350]